MEVLELKPVRNKKVYLYLIKQEDSELLKMDYSYLKDTMKEKKFRFAIVDLNDNESKQLYTQPLSKFLNKFGIPYYNVDIPENVKDYLYVDILEKEVQIKELETEYETLAEDPAQKDSFKAQNLKSWISLLKTDVERKKKSLETSLKPQWVVKQILDLVQDIKNEKFSVMHFVPEKFFETFKSLFEEYNIKVMKFDIHEKKLNQILT